MDSYDDITVAAAMWLEYLGKIGVAELPLTEGERALRRIGERIALCRMCHLGVERTNPVAGTGGACARVLFVWGTPGKEQDRSGTPVAGDEGALLERLVRAMGLEWCDVYVSSIVRCRPPDGRPATPEEVMRCIGYLEEEIDLISPVVVVALGDEAAEALLGQCGGVAALRGSFHPYRSTMLLATHHPAVLIERPALKLETWDDMQRVMGLLSEWTAR